MGTKAVPLAWITNTWEWEHISEEELEISGSQHFGASLVRRKAPVQGAAFEQEKYFCKWCRIDRGKSNNKNEEREYTVLSSLYHENILRYVDAIHRPGPPPAAGLITEFCSGGDLSQFLAPNGPHLTTWQCAQVFHQVAQALMYIHHGVYKYGDVVQLVDPGSGDWSHWKVKLHRDIKPANIFVVQRDHNDIHIRLGDFGLAKEQTDGSDTYVGTYEYQAPEQSRKKNEEQSFRGSPRTTLKCDIWALGLTIRKLLDKQVHPATSLLQCLEKLLEECRLEDDHLRPNSAVLVETLESDILRGNSLPRGMIHQGLATFLKDTSVSAADSGPRSSEKCVLLCRRLLELGLKPGQDALACALEASANLHKNTPIEHQRAMEQVIALIRDHDSDDYSQHEARPKAKRVASATGAEPISKEEADTMDYIDQFEEQKILPSRSDITRGMKPVTTNLRGWSEVRQDLIPTLAVNSGTTAKVIGENLQVQRSPENTLYADDIDTWSSFTFGRDATTVFEEQIPVGNNNITDSLGMPAKPNCPCICHNPHNPANDPTLHCRRLKKWPSQLMIHLRPKHRFFACARCFRVFGSAVELEKHRNSAKDNLSVCPLSCVTPYCENYHQQHPYTSPCRHGSRNSSRDIWREWYRIGRNEEPPAYAPFPETEEIRPSIESES